MLQSWKHLNQIEGYAIFWYTYVNDLRKQGVILTNYIAAHRR